MKHSILVALIFFAQVAFMFGTYGSHFFGLNLPYNLVILIWLGLPTLIAAIAYCAVLANVPALAGTWRVSLLSVVASCISLYAGALLAVNTFGE
jgi:hypothetical protein